MNKSVFFEITFGELVPQKLDSVPHFIPINRDFIIIIDSRHSS